MLSEASFSVDLQYANGLPVYFVRAVKADSSADIHCTKFLWEVPRSFPLSAAFPLTQIVWS